MQRNRLNKKRGLNKIYCNNYYHVLVGFLICVDISTFSFSWSFSTVINWVGGLFCCSDETKHCGETN